jgi:hypothetical protein
MDKKKLWNTTVQICLPFFTIMGFFLTSLKFPEWGLASNLFAQLFWIPSSYRAWKEADQFGIFASTLIITMILIGGVINYWML